MVNSAQHLLSQQICAATFTLISPSSKKLAILWERAIISPVLAFNGKNLVCFDLKMCSAQHSEGIWLRLSTLIFRVRPPDLGGEWMRQAQGRTGCLGSGMCYGHGVWQTPSAFVHFKTCILLVVGSVEYCPCHWLQL